MKGVLQLVQLLRAAPAWQLAAGGAVVLALVLWRLGARLLFVYRLRRAVRDPETAGAALRRSYSPRALLARSRLIEAEARRSGRAILRTAGIDDLWIERFVAKKRRADLERVLHWVAPRGLFRCFVAVMDRPRLAPVLFAWLRGPDGGMDIHRLALAGRGEPFDGRAARITFRDHLDEIRRMTGDPEWPSRYFAVRILLHDDDERSTRALWDALRDGHPLVRRTVIEGFVTGDRQRLYDELYRILLDDPVYEVRHSAWERIHREMEDLYHLNPDSLSDAQAYHVLELLRPDSKYDENIALRFLASDSLEHRLAASRFLERSLALERLAQEVDLGDREALERNAELLRKAAEVGSTSFLAIVERTSKPATLLVCARILGQAGDRRLIVNLARKVYSLHRSGSDQNELYRVTVRTVARRGPAAALSDLNRELLRRRNDKAELGIILAELPEGSENIFGETLVEFLKDPEFPLKDELRRTIARTMGQAVLPVLFDILHSERRLYPHAVRIQALELLAELGLPYCLQAVLENLPILPVEEAVGIANVLARFPRDALVQKVEGLLGCHDARVRAALIAVLPATGEREYLRLIRPALKDADPDVRVATVWALVALGDTRALAQAVDLLRDPVERVRVAAARAVASRGSEEALDRLREVLEDPNEVDAVREAAVEGLGSCESPLAVDLLVTRLREDPALREPLVEALAHQTSRRNLARLVEAFREADPPLRDLLAQSFRRMGSAGEQALQDLAAEQVPSLQPCIAEILEATGAVEARIRDLAHRDPAVRREAAEFLSRLGSRAAFRGIVLAARDPDEEVRVRVVKALERLETEAGKEILAALQNDPDRRVRTYTAWALERLRAKAL